MNLTKDVKDLYSKGCETLMKETLTQRKGNRFHPHGWEAENTVKMSTLLKTIYTCNEIPITLTKTFVTELEQIIPKFIWNDNDPKHQKQN